MKYHLARGEEQLGTFNDLDVSAGLREKRFLPTDLCWAEGMKEWQALGLHMQELAASAGVEAAVEAPAISALREEVRQDLVREQELASRGQRLAAKLIDWIMLMVPSGVMYAKLMDAAFKAEFWALQNDPAALMNAMQRQIEKIQATGDLTLTVMGGIMDVVVIANVLLLTLRGQTLGKCIMGIQIVRCPSGSRAGFVRAVLLRGLVFIILSLFGPIGLMLMMVDTLMIFRQNRRCLHDLVADTMVTKRNG